MKNSQRNGKCQIMLNYKHTHIQTEINGENKTEEKKLHAVE